MNVYSYLISLLKTVMSRGTGRYVYLRSKVMFTVCKGPATCYFYYTEPFKTYGELLISFGNFRHFAQSKNLTKPYKTLHYF